MKIVLIVVYLLITGYFAFCALYIFLYAFSGLFYRNRKFPEAKQYRYFAILVPAYKADKVIEELAHNVLLQDYPRYDLIIIADSMDESVIARLEKMPVKVMRFSDDNRTKALALNTIMAQLPDGYYDAALILDSDNLIRDNDYLKKLNDAFDSGLAVIQTHRTAKNTNTALAILDAASEEINNTLFRRGHATLGLSSALIGSAMAFDYALFKEQMKTVSSSGEDKEMEMRLLKANVRVEYLDDLVVLDEKTQQADAFVTQRARWIANQVMQARMNTGEGFRQLFRGNFDFFDKVMQHFLLPRVLLLASVLILTLASVLFLPPPYYCVWITIFSTVCIGMLISVPRRMYNLQLFKALTYFPAGVYLMFRSLLKIKGATRKFHATEHGIIQEGNIRET